MKKFLLVALASSLFLSCGNPVEALPKTSPKTKLEIRGADVSFYDQISSCGGKYFYNGKEFPLDQILSSANVNLIRLRLWVNPENQWCNLEHTLKAAEYFTQAGFNFLLDIHYSDTWADPSQQIMPAAWKDYSLEQVRLAVGEYTSSVLKAFKSAGAEPSIVQVGNEITNGMLWPYGTTTGGNCENLMNFLKAGIQSVREELPSAKIMLHLDRGGDNTTADWWFSEAKKAGLDYDLIGLSYYPFFHGTDLKVLKNNISSLKKKYGKNVIVVETSYPWSNGWNDNTQNQIGQGAELLSDCSATVDGQKKYLGKLCKAVEEAGGEGVVYWGADSISVNGYENALENQVWFDFNNNWNGISY